MEYNYEKLFPKLADGKGGTDGYLNLRYMLRASEQWDEKLAKVEKPKEEEDGKVSSVEWHSYRRDLDFAIYHTWDAVDCQLDDWLDTDADSFPEEVMDFGKVSWGDSWTGEEHECTLDYWLRAHNEVEAIKKRNESYASNLSGFFHPLREYCAQLNEDPVGDAMSALFPNAVVLAVSLGLLLVGQHAEAGAGFIPTILKDLFFPLLIVAVVSGIKALLGLYGLITAPKTKQEIRQELERIAKNNKIDESLDAIRRRLAYYHLWIDSGVLSEEARGNARATVNTLEEWVSRYEADRAGQTS